MRKYTRHTFLLLYRQFTDLITYRYFSTSRISHAQEYIRKQTKFDLSRYPPERIRNFSIIAHIDHGKSTLADRILEFAGTIERDEENKQVLDTLPVERERGITVKAQTASLFHTYQGITYMLNLIDTPGHIDFHYEVSRSLGACQGVILLVDSNQGVQAQTVANFYLAFGADLVIIPVLNKIDLPGSNPESTCEQLKTLFDIQPSDCLQVSAKLGTGIKDLLDSIVTRISPPPASKEQPMRAYLFDSVYNKQRGAIVNVAILGGSIKKGDCIVSSTSKGAFEVQEVGIKFPHEYPTDCLYAGQVGYVIAGMKNTKDAIIGDTLVHAGVAVDALPMFKPAKPMVFAGIYPISLSNYDDLRLAILKLTMNDSSVSIHDDSSPALGDGWRLGFLGLLHMEVFTQRLEQEYDISVLVTSPNVPYKVKIKGEKNIKKYGSDELMIVNPAQLPEVSIITQYFEPVVLGTIITPDSYLSKVTSLCMDRRGQLKDQIYIDNNRIMIKATLPLNEIIVNFFNDLMTMTSGYASFDYEDVTYAETVLVKLTFLVNGEELEEMTTLCHVSRARSIGHLICSRLVEEIPRQQYKVIIQVVAKGNIIIRDEIKPYRKDVTAKLYGGDTTRKTKLLKRQKEGKAKMKKLGNIEIPRDIFIRIMRR